MESIKIQRNTRQIYFCANLSEKVIFVFRILFAGIRFSWLVPVVEPSSIMHIHNFIALCE